MNWLLLRGSRFHDILGIMILAISADCLMGAISGLRDGLPWFLYRMASAGLAFLGGAKFSSVSAELQSYESESRSEKYKFDPNPLRSVLKDYQMARPLARQLSMGICLAVWALALLVFLSVLQKVR